MIEKLFSFTPSVQSLEPPAIGAETERLLESVVDTFTFSGSVTEFLVYGLIVFLMPVWVSIARRTNVVECVTWTVAALFLAPTPFVLVAPVIWLWAWREALEDRMQACSGDGG